MSFDVSSMMTAAVVQGLRHVDAATTELVSARTDPGAAVPAGCVKAAGVDYAVPRRPESTDDLFTLLKTVGNLYDKPFDRIDVRRLATEIREDGTILFRFEDGSHMAVDAFVRGAQSRGLLSPGARVHVALDRVESERWPAAQNYCEDIFKTQGVRIHADVRSTLTIVA
jgi:hypothetical protein